MAHASDESHNGPRTEAVVERKISRASGVRKSRRELLGRPDARRLAFLKKRSQSKLLTRSCSGPGRPRSALGLWRPAPRARAPAGVLESFGLLFSTADRRAKAASHCDLLLDGRRRWLHRLASKGWAFRGDCGAASPCGGLLLDRSRQGWSLRIRSRRRCGCPC